MIWHSLFVAAILTGSVGGGSTAQLRQLKSDEIVTALRDHYVAYAPANAFDAGVHEEFHRNGRWQGLRYSRGPIGFAGRWKVERDELCIRSDQPLPGVSDREWMCRKVWENSSGALLMAHMHHRASRLDFDLMQLAVRRLRD